MTAEVLPETLEDIAYYPQMRLDIGIDYHNHIERLIGAIAKCLPEPTGPAQPDIRHSDKHASSHTQHHPAHHSGMPLSEATQHKKFGRAEALAISVVGFAMLLAVLLDRGFSVSRLELAWIAFLITAPSIFVCNYVLGGPDTWRETWRRQPIVSALLRVLARTIEASCWLFGVWMAVLRFFGPDPGSVGPDYFVAMIAISFVTAATAIYLFLYKWRWAKALRSSPKP